MRAQCIMILAVRRAYACSTTPRFIITLKEKSETGLTLNLHYAATCSYTLHRASLKHVVCTLFGTIVVCEWVYIVRANPHGQFLTGQKNWPIVSLSSGCTLYGRAIPTASS